MRRVLKTVAKVVGLLALLGAAAVTTDYLRHQAKFRTQG